MANYTIETRPPLDSEIDQMVALMNRVWLDTYREDGFYQFDRHLFEWYASRSLQRDDCFWLATEPGSGRIIGFALAMPRWMMTHGKGPHLFGYISLITVEREFQRQGIAKAIAESALVTGRKTGVKGWFAVIEENSKGLKPVRKDVTEHGIPLWTHEHAYIRPLNVGGLGKCLKMKWYERIAVRLVQGVPAVDDSRIRDVRPADYGRLVTLLNRYSSMLDFGRVWERDELAQYYANPIVRGKVFETDGEVKAVANAAVVPFSIQGRACKLAILEHLQYEQIPLPEQRLLIRSLLYDLKRAGVAFATDFGIGYNSPRAIRANRFFKYPRKMTLYLFPMADDEVVVDLKARCGTTYIDVR